MLPYWLWVGELDSKTCDLIIEKSHQFKLKQAEIHDSNGNPIKNDTRISDIRWVQEDDFLYSLVHRYFVHANRQFGVDTAAVYEVQYTEYKGGQKGHYDWHTDTFSKNTGFDRKLSIVIQLSDPSDYEGGNFLFWNDSPEGFKERGSVLVFPSFRPHKVEPVTKGLRRSLVSWIEGPAWR
jgi:PKHD-type hydroxylase